MIGPYKKRIAQALPRAYRPTMLSSVECMAKADEMDVLARECAHRQDRDAYAETALGWRHTAVLARRQEAWDALNPMRPPG